MIGPDGSQVTSSASFGGTDEDALLTDPAPGTYTVHIVNYDLGTTDDWLGGRSRSPPDAALAPTASNVDADMRRYDLRGRGRRGEVKDIDGAC